MTVTRRNEKAIRAAIAAAVLVGDGLIQLHVVKGGSKADQVRFLASTCSKTEHFTYVSILPEFFQFNNPEAACRTCGGLGVDKLTHPDLLIPDPRRSIRTGCFVREAYRYNPDTWDGRIMYTLSQRLGFSLDTPWNELSDAVRNTVLYGVEGRFRTVAPPESTTGRVDWDRHEVGFGGIARRIERQYRRYRQSGQGDSRMEAWLDKVMVEHECPDCKGSRLKATRLLFTIDGKSIYDVSRMHFDELHAFLGKVVPTGRGAGAGRQIIEEIRGRVSLLLGIGLDYLS